MFSTMTRKRLGMRFAAPMLALLLGASAHAQLQIEIRSGVERPVPMAIVPQGTGNLLARNLGLPLGLEASIRVAFGGEERRIDVGVLGLTRQDGSTPDPEVFLVVAGMGMDAEMIRATRP